MIQPVSFSKQRSKHNLLVELDIFIINRLKSGYVTRTAILTLTDIRNWRVDLRDYIIQLYDELNVGEYEQESGTMFLGTVIDVYGDTAENLNNIRQQFRAFNKKFPHKGETFVYKTKWSRKRGFHLISLPSINQFNTLDFE